MLGFLYKFFKKNGMNYIICNIAIILIFGFLYYYSYNLLINNKEFCKKYNLGTVDDNLNEIPFMDGVSLALVTQATVGYSDVINRKDNISLAQLNSNLLNIINNMQLIVVILTIAYFI